MNKTKISVSWSGGKDSAFALWKLLDKGQFDVAALHTTFGEQTRRVGMHGVHEDLIEAQVASIGIPLHKIYYPASGDNAAYEKKMGEYLLQLEREGIRHIGFGDILLEDLKKYREERLAEKNFSAVFPLWSRDTKILSRDFIQSGFKTKICAADADKICMHWVGRDYDIAFLNQLPADVDPCGENGEFHSFCYDGPIFSAPLTISTREVVRQSYDIVLENGEKSKKHYWFADLVQVGS